MFGEECGCMLCVFALLVIVFVGVALLHYPTRKKQKELEYMLRQAQDEWKGEKKAGETQSWDQQTPE